MRHSKFNQPNTVLIFNDTKKLVAIARSLNAAAELMQGNVQAMSFSCSGKYISSGGYYFRRLHPNVLVELDDLDNLSVDEYDKLCGVKRTYHPQRVMNRIHKKLLERRNLKKQIIEEVLAQRRKDKK